MPYCAILSCGNSSKSKNLSKGGVSYHRFPRNPSLKLKWIAATGKQNWMPTKSSTICSEHFDEKCVIISNKGYNYLKLDAVPNHKIVTFFENQSYTEPETCMKGFEAEQLSTECSSDILTKIAPKDEESEFTKRPMELSLRKDTLRNRLEWAQNKLKKQKLKIKQLLCRNRRLNIKLKEKQEHLKVLQEKFSLTDKDLKIKFKS